jgi:hypothetical protein
MHLRKSSRGRPLRLSYVLALSALAATGCAFLSVFSVSLLPPKATPRHVQIAAASTHVLLDAPKSWIFEKNAGRPDFENLGRRGTMLGNMLASPPVLERVAERMGVPSQQVAAISRITSNVTETMTVPNLEMRVTQIEQSRRPYRLDIQPDPNRPVLTIYAQAPTEPEAVKLADAAFASLHDELETQSNRARVSERWQIRIEQLGDPRGAVINAGTEPQIVVLTFLLGFCIAAAVILGTGYVRREWRAARMDIEPDEEPYSPPRTWRSPAAGPATTTREKLRVLSGGDWPRTTRILPWMIAGFIVVIWLVPFNKIELTASLPFDLKFDRLVLPFVVGIWVLALATGGPNAPRIRGTWIHVGIGAFVIVATLSVVLDAQYLNHTLEFDLASKKIVLLLSFAVFFLVVSSSIRRSEVPAFFKFTLILAVIAAFGTLWEDRFHYNWFYEIPRMVLPGIFRVGDAESGMVDLFGRHLTRGPAEHPLETVAMITMALPIAFVGILHATNRRDRILYGLAACILLAGAISTYRKSALLGPLAVILVLAYFRRRQLLKLAPLALPALIGIHALSPGAFGSIVVQLHGDGLGVGTVSDRASDYDAVRPDLWTHLAFGRGYGSYDHVSYRILDSEMLNRIVDTGIIGVLVYVLMLLSILFAARGMIRSRTPVWSPYALAVAAAAVAFLVLSFLFDVTGFPHTPYILMSLAGLLAVMLTQPEPAPTRKPLRHRPAYHSAPPVLAGSPARGSRPGPRELAG